MKTMDIGCGRIIDTFAARDLGVCVGKTTMSSYISVAMRSGEDAKVLQRRRDRRKRLKEMAR